MFADIFELVFLLSPNNVRIYVFTDLSRQPEKCDIVVRRCVDLVRKDVRLKGQPSVAGHVG